MTDAFVCNDPEGDWIRETEEAMNELAVRNEGGLNFLSDNPRLVAANAAEIADVLKDIIVKKQLAMRIGQSEYIKVEGWTTLGALVGAFAQVEWTRKLYDRDPETGADVAVGWEAAVVVTNPAGFLISRAEAECLRSERNWKGRDDFALRSMAQTRAMGKALRMPLGWIATLAGYEATPAEEMPAQDEVEIPFEDAADPEMVALTQRLVEAAAKLKAREATQTAITSNRLEHAADPAKHVAWLRRQVKTAEANVKQAEAQA